MKFLNIILQLFGYRIQKKSNLVCNIDLHQEWAEAHYRKERTRVRSLLRRTQRNRCAMLAQKLGTKIFFPIVLFALMPICLYASDTARIKIRVKEIKNTYGYITIPCWKRTLQPFCYDSIYKKKIWFIVIGTGVIRVCPGSYWVESPCPPFKRWVVTGIDTSYAWRDTTIIYPSSSPCEEKTLYNNDYDLDINDTATARLVDLFDSRRTGIWKNKKA